MVIRGIRNNNPFNIKKSSYKWIGKVESNDPVFEQFKDLKYGCRAGLKLLLNYVRKGFDTPSKIIHRFAPTSENNTKNYIDFIVRNGRGLRYISPDEHIGDIDTLCYMASRMVKYECCLTSSQVVQLCLAPQNMVQYINMFNLNSDKVL